MSEAKIQHFLRPGHLTLERDVFVRLRPTYRGLILNAPSLADRVSGAEFLQALETPTPFLIDPRTYALATPRSELQRRDGRRLKQSWVKLLQEYGVAEDTLPLTPDFARTIAERLAVRAIEFQLSCISAQTQITWFSAPYEHQPTAIIAPYFAVMADQDPWLSLNLELARVTKDAAGKRPVYAVVQLHAALLTQRHQLRSILDSFTDLPVDGFMIWIGGLREKEMSIEEVQSLRMMVETLSAQQSRPVINMYGGYLSALLSSWGLSGFCHRHDGGESRKFTPVGGGRIDTRFYVPALHRHYSIDDVEGYLKRQGIETKDDYFSRMCTCIVCQRVMQDGFLGFSANFAARALKKGWPQALEWSKRLASSHFMLIRNQEVQHVEATTRDLLVEELTLNAERYRDPFSLSPVDTEHLLLWARGLGQR